MSEVIKDLHKCIEMGTRVYNNKMVEKMDEEGKVSYSDENAIKTLCSKIFTKDGRVTNYEDLRSFNALIVEIANQQAEAKIQPIIDAVSKYKKVNKYDQQVYNKIPKRTKVKMALSASATGVDFTKITSTMEQVPARPQTFQFGVKYSISEMVNDPINAFRTAIDEVAQAKVAFLFDKILKLAREGKNSGKVPAKQFKEVTNMTFSEFRTLESALIRRGGNTRPVLIADNSFISDIALKQGSQGLGDGFSILTDELKQSMLRDIKFDIVSKTVAIATDNPFTNFEGTLSDLDPQEALLLVGNGEAPFSITEFGEGVRVTEGLPEVEQEEVHIKLDYRIDITLLLGENLGYIKDSAIVL